MNATTIPTISKYLVLSLLVFLEGCSPLVVIVQPTSEAPLPESLPTIALSPTIETTAVPTVQPTAVPVSPPTAAPEPTETRCQDSAQYIDDDGLDGSTYAPNTPFTKTWTLKNTGSCTWNSRYLVFQISGTTMTQQPGYWIVQQGETVAPGQTLDLNVGMTSPVGNGNYKSYWGLKNGDGQLMPIQGGAKGNSFYVMIKVDDDSAAEGKVTSASIDIDLEQGSGPVCTADSTYFVHASITADGHMAVTYEINSSAGQIPAGNFQNLENNGLSPSYTGTIVFDRSGTKTINTRFVGPYPYPDDITVSLRIGDGEWHNTRLPCQ